MHTATHRFDTKYLKTFSLLGFPTCFQWRGEHPNENEPGNKPENGNNKCTCVYWTFLKDHIYSAVQNFIFQRDIQWCIKIHSVLIQTISIINKFCSKKRKKPYE